MKDQLINILLTALVIVIIPALFVFAKTFIKKCQAQADENAAKAAEAKNKILNIALSRFLGVLYTVVESLEATVKKDINKKMADGSYTLEEAKDAKSNLAPQAYEEAKKIIGPKIIDEIEKEIGNLEALSKASLETYLESLKKRLGNSSNANTSSPLPASN